LGFRPTLFVGFPASTFTNLGAILASWSSNSKLIVIGYRNGHQTLRLKKREPQTEVPNGWSFSP
jgi:hypothetical protein